MPTQPIYRKPILKTYRKQISQYNLATGLSIPLKSCTCQNGLLKNVQAVRNYFLALQAILLERSGGDHWRSVQICWRIPILWVLILATEARTDWQVDGTHPTGMISCY